MIPDVVMDKLYYFDEAKFELQDKEVILYEKDKGGRVELKCTLHRDTMIFNSPAENTLPYLDGTKKGATKCPDDFLFELLEDGTWALHIMEYKKTISTSSIKKSKMQFIMGIYNARAIAGFLNIPITKIYIYSAYRSDKLSERDLIDLRSTISNQEDIAVIVDWKNNRCKLELDLKKYVFQHNKIILDQDGVGTCELRDENVFS